MGKANCTTSRQKHHDYSLSLPTKSNLPMATSSSDDRKKYWLYFLIFLVIFILMLMFMNQWFWVAMPFMLTFLVMALGYM